MTTPVRRDMQPTPDPGPEWPQTDWTVPWHTVVLPIERFTGDRRWFRLGSLSIRSLPMPLMMQTQTDAAHRGSVVVGAVRQVDLGETLFRAGGTWLNPEHVPEVARALELMRNGLARVSADLEPDMEVTAEESPDGGRPFIFYDRARVSGITIVPISAFDQPGLSPLPLFGEDVAALALTGTTSWRNLPAQPRELEYNADQAFTRILDWADGNDAKARTMFLWIDPAAAEGTRDRFRLPIGDIVNGRPALNFHAIYAAAALVSGAHGGLPTVSDEEKGRLRRTISEIYGRLAGLYGDASLVAPWDKRSKLPDVRSAGLDAVAASAAPLAPPDEWFTDPKLPGPVPSPIVTPEGRVMVHLATHSSCHRAIQQQTGQCFTPPPSPSSYARFMDGSVVTASGRTVPVGRITVGTSHPGLGLTAAATKEHYDNTGTCAAIVAAGTDEHGIWLSGALVPEATPEQVAALRRSPISGDWRRHGPEGLDLVAALAVNTAGFPAHYRGAIRSLSTDGGGDCMALVASGAVEGDDDSVTTNDTASTGPTGQPGSTPEPTVPPADVPAPVVDTDQIAVEVAGRVLETLRTEQERDRRLGALFAADDERRAQRLAGLEPAAALAPMADTKAARVKALRAGHALPPLHPDGTPRYPVRNADELRKAIRAVGRAGTDHDGIRRYIIGEARKLKLSDMIPDNWNADGSLK